MSEENTTETLEINLSDEDAMFKYAMDELKQEQTTETKEETDKTDQPEAEVKEETKEEAAEETETPQPEATTEVKTEEVAETVKPETKPPYTPEEIRAIAATGDFSKFDSSRLTPGEQAAMRSMQAGLTPKLQRAAELEKNFQALIEKTRAEEQKRAAEESERKYREDVELVDEEYAKTQKKLRDFEAKIQHLEQQQAARDAELQVEYNRIAIEKFKNSFREKAPQYGIPVTPEWEEEVQSRVLAENYLRSQQGEPFISIDEAMAKITKTVGISDVNSLENLLRANPKLMEALESKILEKHANKKKAGPTTIKSSSSGSSGPSTKPPSAMDKLEITDDPMEDMVKAALLELKEKGD